jgi:hypothetical protein
MSLTSGNKIIRRNFTKMPVTESVIKQAKQMAAKDKMQKGLSFANRCGEEYKFNNDQEYKLVIEPSKSASFSDIAAEALGVFTEQEEVFGVCVCVCVCVCFWPPVTKWGTVMHEIPISSPPLDDIPSIP